MHDGSAFPLVAGLTRATVTDVGPDGRVRVSLPAGDVLWAETVAPVAEADVGRICAVAPLDGEGLLVLGLIGPAPPTPREAVIDGERLVLQGRREVVLRCGKASVTLTADGRVTIRGTQVLSRADGPNRVQGASVQLN